MMTSANLENLVRIGQLKKEAPREDELRGLKATGLDRLADADRPDLSFASRFDLAYSAAHALALFALRQKGHRAENRYLVFHVLPHTTTLGTRYWRVLTKAHEIRNLAEYEGYLEADEQLLGDLIAATRVLRGLLFGE